jgi:hypothetical protein
MKTSADPATRISPDAGREKTPRPARSACFATVATSWTTFAGDGLSGRVWKSTILGSFRSKNDLRSG